MSDSTKQTKSKSTKPKAPPSHPKYSEMVVSAIKGLNHKGGSSKAAIMKYITANYKVGNNVPQINGNVKRALKLGVQKHVLAQPKGVGASGSFKVRKAESKSKGDKKVKKVKKPAKVGTKKPATKKNKPQKKKAAPKAKPAKSRVVKPKKANTKVKKAGKQKTVKKPSTKKATKK